MFLTSISFYLLIFCQRTVFWKQIDILNRIEEKMLMLQCCLILWEDSCVLVPLFRKPILVCSRACGFHIIWSFCTVWTACLDLPRQQEKVAFRYGFHKYNSNKEPLLISMVSFYLRKTPILPELKRLFWFPSISNKQKFDISIGHCRYESWIRNHLRLMHFLLFNETLNR